MYYESWMVQSSNKHIGALGEQLASQYLSSKQYHIIERNAHSRWGELDIVVKKDGKIIFIEVKTRTSFQKGRPYEAVSYGKLKRLFRTIQYYILTHNLEKRKFQLDVIGIVLNPDRSVKELKHYENVGL